MNWFQYDKDPSKCKLKELENRIATLEGKEPPHKKACTYCDGRAHIFCWAGHDSWTEPCPQCSAKI